MSSEREMIIVYTYIEIISVDLEDLEVLEEEGQARCEK